MNSVEIKKLFAVMMATYPNFNPNNIDLAIEVWQDALDEYTYQQASVALKAYIKSDTSGFAPTPGQLIANIHIINKPQELNEQEAWSLVSKALRNGTYGAEEEFAKLPPLVQKAVGHPNNIHNWSQSDFSEIETVIASNFMRTYRGVLATENQTSKMGSDIKDMIDKKNDNPLHIATTSNLPQICVENGLDEEVTTPMSKQAKIRLTEILKGV